MFLNLVYNNSCGVGLAADKAYNLYVFPHIPYRYLLRSKFMPRDISQKEVKKLLTYDKDTGDFHWKKWWRGRKKDLFAGNLNSITGYYRITINGHQYLRSRLAWLYTYGYMPKNIEVDHKNKIPTDDRISNLRLISHECNIRNCSINKNNTSGVSGVSCTKDKKYAASIYAGKAINLGKFDNKIDAVKARYNAELEYDFLECQTNSSAYNYLKTHKAI